MKKIKINQTSFEISDEVLLIINAFQEKLDIYKEKNEITNMEYLEIQKSLESGMLKLLEKDNDITITDTENLIEEIINSNKKFKTDKKSVNVFSGILGFLYNVIVLILQITVLIIRISIWLLLVGLILVGIVFFLGILLLLLFAVPIVFLKIIIGGQDILAILPEVFKYSVVVFEIAIVIFLMSFVGALGKSKESGKGFMTIGLILFVLSLNGFIYSFLHSYYNHNQVFEKTEEFVFKYKDQKAIRLMGFDKFDIDLRDFHINGKLQMTDVDIRRHEGEDVYVKVITKINDSNPISAEQYFDKMNDLDIKLTDSQLILLTHEENVFKEVVPYKFLRREVTIDLPK